MIRAVFDTNVFLSAIVFGGNPERAFLLAREGRIRLLVSPAILIEMASILREKFGWGERDAADEHRPRGGRRWGSFCKKSKMILIRR